MWAFVFFLVTYQCLSDNVKLLAWILIAFLVCMTPVLSTVFNRTVVPCQFLSIDQLSRDCVPEACYVEAIDSSQDVTFLLPE